MKLVVQVNWFGVAVEGLPSAPADHGLIGPMVGKAPNWSLAVGASWLGGVGQLENSLAGL